jgi:hypothetical protein
MKRESVFEIDFGVAEAWILLWIRRRFDVKAEVQPLQNMGR